MSSVMTVKKMAQRRRDEMLNLQDYTTKQPSFTRGKMDEKKIELYWKQLCNQEKTSKSRNKALLDDFERIEHQSAILDAQTKKLKSLRDRYEGYINTMYPRWLDELKHFKEQVQYERDKLPSQGTHQPEDMKPNRRPSNNVRFASPTYLEQEHQSLQTSSFTQDTVYPGHSYYDQSSIPTYPTGRLKTLDCDNYHRDPSFDYYHLGQVSSMRTPQGHLPYQPRPDYMRFSTPYNPAHSGPFDSINGFSQSFEVMHPSPGYERDHRHPNMGPPMRYAPPKDHRHPNRGPPVRYAPPSRPMDEYERVPYGDNARQEMLRPENLDASYQQPNLRTGFNNQDRQVASESRHNKQENRLPEQHLNGVRSPPLEPVSPYARDPPEKPLEITTNVQVKTTKKSSDSTPEKLSSIQRHPKPTSPHRTQSDLDAPRKPDDNLSGNSESSPLDLSDLRARESDSNTLERQVVKDNSPGERAIRGNNVETKSTTESPSGNVKENLRKNNDGDDLLDMISDGSLSLSSEDISKGEGSLIDEDNVRKQCTDAVESDTHKTLEEVDTPDRHPPGVTEKESGKISHHKIPVNKAPVEMKQHDDDKSGGERAEEAATPSTAKPRHDATPIQDQKPSVSVEVFLTLLKVVDADIEVSFSPQTLYHAPRCSQTMKDDIIMTAENGGRLETYDPSSISMILLEELTRLTRACPSGGLIKRDAMESVINQPNKLRDSIDPSMMLLWNGLLSHFIRMVVHNVMAVDEVTDLFTISLLASNSPYIKKFQIILADLIKKTINKRMHESPVNEEMNLDKNSKNDQHDNRSLTSEESTTLGSTPPQSAKQDDLPIEDPPATPASLERTLSYEDDFEEEDIPLTETTAYRKMMSSAQSNHSDVADINRGNAAENQNHDSEGDDDLERTLARSISPPIVSPRQRSPVATKPTEKKKPGRQKPKLSIFSGGGDSLGLSYGSEDLGDSWGAGEGGRLSSSWKSEKSDNTDKTESPPSSPDLDAGYVPTAMEENKKKEPVTIPKTATRKPGFWNHSDTESEVDLQLSTGVVDEEDDDFDFYG